LAIHNVGAVFFPSSYLGTAAFLDSTAFVKKLAIIWLTCKFALMKYVGIWLLGEGACILSGIGYAGFEKGKHRWNGLSNVDPWLFETSLNLHGVVQSFNINTNDWVKRYVFKRLRFLGNKNISSISALAFLAVWHGLYIGYFLCFLFEYFCMEAEAKVQKLTATWYASSISKHPVKRLAYNTICFFVRTSTVHYALVSFELKKWSLSWEVYKSVFFVGHLSVFLVYVVYAASKSRQAKEEKARSE